MTMRCVHKLSLSLISSLFLALGGCSTEDRPEQPAAGNQNAQDPGHQGGGAMDDHGEPHPLGELSAHGVNFEVTQLGHIEAGEEGAVELTFASAAERISTVRGWVGIESGQGSMKKRWDIEGDAGVHGHVDVPDPIPAGSKIWIELEKDGKTETVSVDFATH